ncbi:ribonuclease H-like domain-containing protein [Tanacetum coccineum]
MTSNSKVGLGYEIQSNNEVLSYEEEMNRTVFKCTEEDFLNKPLYSRFSKIDNFKGVPHPLTGDYTPKPQEEIDDSLYVYGKKGPQKPEISDSDDTSTEHSTCQSNDSEGSFGNPSEHSSESESESISVPKEMSTSKSVTTNEKVVSEPKSTEVEPSCVTHVKTPRQQMKNQETPKVNRKNWNEMMERELGEGYSFIKKKCFVCGSLSHLIRDCDFYEKKMAREAEHKNQRVFNTGNGVAKPVWNNANRVNHANHFVPRPVQLIAVRQNVNSVRPNVNTDSFNIDTIKAKQPINTSISNRFSPVRSQGNWGTAVKLSAGYNWRKTRPNSNCNSGSNYIRTDHPLKNMEDRGIFDSGCSGHMTGNKDHLDDFKECKGGSVTFGGTSEVTNSAGTLQTPHANVSKEEDEAGELIVVPTSVKHTAAKTILRELDELAQKHLREVPKNKATSTNSVNFGSGQDDTQPADQDDSVILELTIFNKPKKGIFDKASYDDEERNLKRFRSSTDGQLGLKLCKIVVFTIRYLRQRDYPYGSGRGNLELVHGQGSQMVESREHIPLGREVSPMCRSKVNGLPCTEVKDDRRGLIVGLGLVKLEAWYANGVFLGVVAANMIVVTSSLSLVALFGICGGVEKPSGGVISLPFVMPEK